MAWTFPVERFEAHPESREHLPEHFKIPSAAEPALLLVAGRALHYLAYHQSDTGDTRYWACPRVGDPILLDPERVETAMISGVQRSLPSRPNAITFLNRIIKLPEHMAWRIISHVENSSIKTIYQDNLDLGMALRSAYRTLGHSTQRDMEVCFMAHQLFKVAGSSARDSLVSTYNATRPGEWVDEAIRRSNKMYAQQKAAERGAAADMDLQFGFG